jgi:hypothetical protein
VAGWCLFKGFPTLPDHGIMGLAISEECARIPGTDPEAETEVAIRE